jgi:Ca2+-binding RTX toxin-like protein
MAYYNGTSGNSVIVADGNGADVMKGDAGSDRLNGTHGNDTIKGGSGNDNLAGQQGNDYLQGDSGDDILFGGSGSDFLFGGYGADKFVFDDFNSSNGTVDIIKDFKLTQGDTLLLKNGVMITGAEFAELPDSLYADGARLDVRLTLTSDNGSTQDLWLADVITNIHNKAQGREIAALEDYLESLGYTGGLSQAA